MSPWMQPISHNLIVKMGLAEKWNHKDIKGQNCSVSGLISFISCRAPQAPDRKVPAVIRQSSWLKAWTAKAIISVPVRGGVVLWNECFLHRNAITARRCDKNIWEPQYCVSKQKYLGNLSGQWRLGRFVELDYDYKNFDIQQWANKWKFRKSKLFFFFFPWKDMKNALCACPLVYFYQLNEFSASAHPQTVCHTTSKHLLRCFHVCCDLSFAAETTSHFSGWTWWSDSSG